MVKMIRGYLPILVLQSLAVEPKTSYGIKEHIGEFWDKKPSSGSLFPVIAKLCYSKYVSHKLVDGKKIFNITKKGQTYLDKLISEKEDNIVDHVVLLKSLAAINSNHTFAIVDKIVARTDEPARSNFKFIQTAINEHHRTLQVLMSKKLSESQEENLKELYSEFVKKVSAFNKRVSK